jgi:hypothetical protein
MRLQAGRVGSDCPGWRHRHFQQGRDQHGHIMPTFGAAAQPQCPLCGLAGVHLGWQPQLDIAQRYAKVRKGEGWMDSQIRGQWSGDRNWASGEALQTEEKEECTTKSVEALIPFQPEAAL